MGLYLAQVYTLLCSISSSRSSVDIWLSWCLSSLLFKFYHSLYLQKEAHSSEISLDYMSKKHLEGQLGPRHIIGQKKLDKIFTQM